jgi:tetratricopeptide (TPR) repeat protein
LEFEKGLQAFDQYEFSTAHAAFAAAAVRDSSNPLPLAWQSRTETLMRRDKEAVDTATQALRLLTEDVVDRDRLFVEAVANEARGDASVAAARYQDLVSRYPDEVGWLIERAGFEDRNGRAADAVSSYHAALAADPSLVRPHVELCRLYVPTRLNEPVLAKQQGELARAKYNALGHASGQAQALWCLVDVMRRGTEHDVAGAKRHAEAALTLMQGLGYPYGLSRAYNYLAFVALAENRNADAAALWEKSLALGRQVGYVLLESRVLMNLGVAYEALGQRETALTRYRESFDRFEEMGNEQDAASSQVNAAVIQIQFGRDPEQGLRDAQNALAVFRKIGDKNFEVFARLHIAAFYRHTARWEEAERELAQADALSTQNNLPSKKTRVDIELGRLYFDRGAYAKALPRFTSALVNSPPNDRLQAWIGLGRTHARVGDLASARGDLQKASQELETQGDSGSLAALSLAQGELAYESEQHADARAHFNRASAWWTSSFPDPASLDARAYLGFLDAVSGHSSGRELLVQTLAQARQMQRASLAARCQLFLVRLAILGRQFDEAQTRLRDLSPAVESLLAPELRAQLHHWRAQLLVQSNQPQRAAEEAAAAGRSMADLRSLVPDTDRDRVLSRPDLRFIH